MKRETIKMRRPRGNTWQIKHLVAWNAVRKTGIFEKILVEKKSKRSQRYQGQTGGKKIKSQSAARTPIN